MKKTASIIISFIMIISLITTLTAQSSYIIDIDNSYAVDEYDYIVDDYYILMLDDTNCSISYYGGTRSVLEIPSDFYYDESNYATVRRIAIQSYCCNDYIVDVTIPNTVEYIGDCAFFGCPYLKKVIIPPSVKEIGWSAFETCDKLTIYGYTNTVAEAYAKENNIPFVSIGVYTQSAIYSSTTATQPTTKISKTTTSNPSKVTKVKLKAKKKKIKVSWKKVSKATGYQVKYSTSKKFRKTKTKTKTVKKNKVTLKKLKLKKKYYVKVRAYKKVNLDGYTVTAYGVWSKVKSKKVK